MTIDSNVLGYRSRVADALVTIDNVLENEHTDGFMLYSGNLDM